MWTAPIEIPPVYASLRGKSEGICIVYTCWRVAEAYPQGPILPFKGWALGLRAIQIRKLGERLFIVETGIVLLLANYSFFSGYRNQALPHLVTHLSHSKHHHSALAITYRALHPKVLCLMHHPCC